jgi:esterase/lipase superfamily enzyme
MINTLARFIETGQIKLFTVDSLDNESWANWDAHPADRARRHQDYDRYIVEEVVPFMRSHSENTDQKFVTTGVSMGAYHAANFFFRHPDVFDTVIALSGLYGLNHFIGDYMDDNVYFNAPLAYLANMEDPWYLEQYQDSHIIICVGQGAWEDEMLRDTLALKQILEQKEIPAWVDIWGHDVNHDWPWWHKMLPYFLDTLELPSYNPT